MTGSGGGGGNSTGSGGGGGTVAGGGGSVTFAIREGTSTERLAFLEMVTKGEGEEPAPVSWRLKNTICWYPSDQCLPKKKKAREQAASTDIFTKSEVFRNSPLAGPFISRERDKQKET